MFHAPDNSWRTVCDDSFDDAAARVFCRSMGYVGGIVVPLTVGTFDANGVFLYDDVTCTGAEADLSQCDFTLNHDCSVTEQVAVRCTACDPHADTRLVGTDDHSGRVDVRSTAASPWTSVCSAGFDVADARTACRSLCFADGSVLPPSLVDVGTVSIGLTGVSCTGTERSLLQCPAGTDTSSCSPATVRMMFVVLCVSVLLCAPRTGWFKCHSLLPDGRCYMFPHACVHLCRLRWWSGGRCILCWFCRRYVCYADTFPADTLCESLPWKPPWCASVTDTNSVTRRAGPAARRAVDGI